MKEPDESDERLAYYLEIGAVSLEGMDENGEMIYSITELAKDIAPELWQSHIEYVDKSLMELYEEGLVEVEYDENLEATLHLTEEGKKIAKLRGLVEMDFKDIPND
jgi:Mn-dependent DtxR family transcriptional regulator